MSATIEIPVESRRPASEEVAAAPPGEAGPPQLDTIAMRWQLALDAADHALAAAHGPVHIPDADGRRRELVQERLGTAQLLTQLGRLTGVQPLPWLSLGADHPQDARSARRRHRLPVRPRRRPDRQRRPARLGLGRGLRRVPPAPERDDRVALHPVRPRLRLPRLHRRPRSARGSPYVPREPRHPAPGGTLRRPRRCGHRVRPGPAQG